MRNPSYTKKGPGRRHNHETVARANARKLREGKIGRHLVGAADGMARAVEVAQ
jgi:hypothetical protein